MSRTDQKNIDEKRLALAEAQKARASEVYELSKDRQTYKQARALYGDHDERTQNAKSQYNESLEKLVASRGQIKKLKTDINDLLKQHLNISPEEEYAQLDGRFPIVMLPLRLETRFHHGNNGSHEPGTLKVRVYPDGIAAQSHQPLLSEEEQGLGHHYWNTAFEMADEQIAWQGIIKDTSPMRAAWIVKQTQPQNMNEFPDTPASNNNGQVPQPNFPNLELSPKEWRELTECRVLPDRWLLLAYRDGDIVHQAVSDPIREPLALTLNLGSDGEEEELNDNVALSDDGLEVDEELLWSFKFDKALEAGMAIEVPLDLTDIEKGFDRVIVLGIKTSLNPEHSSSRLSELIDSHHYTRGLSFLKQGSPTNNSSGENSVYPQSDPNGEDSFRAERGDDLTANGGDGARVMQSLGLPMQIAAHVDGADRDEQTTAEAMADALWPATIGYFLEHLMSPHFDDDVINDVRTYFTQYVRGRGPLPALRIGSVPYGILPVSSLSHWQMEDDAEGPDKHLPPFLARLLRSWKRFADTSPRINRTDDPDADLITTLSLDASSRKAYIRNVIGPETRSNSFNFFGFEMESWESYHENIARLLIEVTGLPGMDPRLLWMNFGNESSIFPFGFVTDSRDEVLSETERLKFNYISWIRGAFAHMLRYHTVPKGMKQPKSLLYLMLRHAYLTEIARSGRRVLYRRNIIEADEMIEHEFVGITPKFEGQTGHVSETIVGETTATVSALELNYRPSLWDRLGLNVPGITEGEPLGTYLTKPIATPRIPEDEALIRYRTSLMKIENLPTAELERLFGETLDVCSHRIDAWITSLATKRLKKMRDEEPEGCYFGAYGWIEDLRPKSLPEVHDVQLSDVHQYTAIQGEGGYIYGPTMSHVATGAILRNAHETRNGADKRSYAVDLSSKRVRTALWFMDSVRDGQPIGAVLGYHFERGLHERHGNLNLDKYKDNFRNLYPLVANKAEDSDEPADAIAARNVVDGLRLYRAWRKNKIQWGQNGLPVNGSTDKNAIDSELRELADIIDAVSDVLTAESVYQMATGNPDGINATLDTMNKGIRPPELEITHTPRSGTDIQYRIGVILGGDAPADHAWHTAPVTWRAEAEPRLNAWSGNLLGELDKIKCDCKVSFPDPANPDATIVEIIPVKLSDLRIQPIDFLALVKSAEAEQGETELDRRIRHIALKDKPADSQVEINYEGFLLNSDERTIPQVLEIALTLNNTLSRARPLKPTDLLAPEHEEKISEADLLNGETDARFDNAIANLEQAISDLDTALDPLRNHNEGDPEPSLQVIRTSLIQAAQIGVPGTYPHSHTGDGPTLRLALMTQGESILEELQNRRQKANNEVEDKTKAIKHIFGEEFVFLPRFIPADQEQLGLALANPPIIDGNPESIKSQWFAQVAQIRNVLRDWRKLSLYTNSSGMELTNFDILQFPYKENARWAAMPFDKEENRPVRGTISTMLYRAVTPASDQSWCGLLLDDFLEQIPSKEEETAVAFNYDAPGLEAPQAVLIVTPPKIQENWDYESIVASISQTLDMAKVRTVDGEDLEVLSQILPMTYVAANPADDTISTPFIAMMMAEAVIVGQEGD